MGILITEGCNIGYQILFLLSPAVIPNMQFDNSAPMGMTGTWPKLPEKTLNIICISDIKISTSSARLLHRPEMSMVLIENGMQL